MRKENRSMRRYTGIFITFIAAIMVMLIVAAVSSNTFSISLETFLSPLSHWINQHRLIVLFWHILLIFTIYLAVGAHINRYTKHREISSDQLRKIRRFRWFLILSLIAMDLLIGIRG